KWSKRQLIDGIRWRIRTGAPWRDVPDCYGHWRTVYGLYRRWQRDGTWARILTALQQQADAHGLITWDVSVDSTITRAHQHAAGARPDGHRQKEPPGGISGVEPDDHALGRSRGGLTTKLHLAWRTRPQNAGVGAHRRTTRRQPAVDHRAGTYPGAQNRPRPPAYPPTTGAGRQGLQQHSQSGLSTQPGNPVCHPGQGRPGHPPPQPRPSWWAATGVRPDRLPAAPRRGVWHQPTQTAPCRGHPLRQTRRTARSHRHHQHDQHLAPLPGTTLMKHGLALRWLTGHMTTIGWMSKTGGWQITDSGVEALETYQDPGE